MSPNMEEYFHRITSRSSLLLYFEGAHVPAVIVPGEEPPMVRLARGGRARRSFQAGVLIDVDFPCDYQRRWKARANESAVQSIA